jgi:oxygen-dependent protoporphyrinogen oxidase
LRAIVVGAGIAGLAAALTLSARHDVLVLEREPLPGGKIRSQRLDGYLFDWGPNGFLSNAAEVHALAAEAGIEGELKQAGSAATKRSVYWNGKLHALPEKPQQALGLSLLSPLGKLRALGELFVRAPRSEAAHDETVYAFFERRFGREVAERLVSPALLGISGGDAKTAAVDAIFPRVREMEREHGSVLRGMVRGRRAPGRLTSFGAGGMQRLTDAVALKLGERVRCGRAARRVEPRDGGWRVVDGNETVDAEAAVLAVPSDAAATLVEGFDPVLAELLRRIPYAPMRVAGIAFRPHDVPVPLDGFGFLVARGEGVRILGALYTSTIFPDQAPPDTAYVRVFLGGATDPGALDLDGDAARAIVRADLATTLGITAEPLAYHDVLWPRAIPQYGLAHRALLAEIDARVELHPGLSLAGNAYRGLGVGDSVREAVAVAARIG